MKHLLINWKSQEIRVGDLKDLVKKTKQSDSQIFEIHPDRLVLAYPAKKIQKKDK